MKQEYERFYMTTPELEAIRYKHAEVSNRQKFWENPVVTIVE